jgi:CBS domain containing-hemolysin-like protein
MQAHEISVTLLQLAAVPLLVLLNGFFVAAEFALVKIRATQLETLVARGHRRARVAQRIVHNLDAALSATQLGITLASLGLGWVGKPVFIRLLAPALTYFNVSPEQADWIAFAVGFAVITFMHIVVGELAPKSLAIQKPLPTSLWVAPPLQWFYWMFYPAIWLLNHAAFWLLRRCGLQPVSESELAHSEEEIRLIISQSRRFAHGPTLGQDIALNAFALRRRHAREVMRPRHEIVALDTETPIAECLALAQRTRYSRFPLCEGGDLDRTLGVVHSKDIVAMRHEAQCGQDLAAIARKIIFIPETARLEKLLTLFLQRKSHLALVVDEYGGTQGLVTLENVLEELVGPIEDEFDQETHCVRQIDGSTWELNGALTTHKLAEMIGQRFNEVGADEACTVSGRMTQRLGRFPRVGDALALDGWELRVEELAGARASRIKLTRRAGAGGGQIFIPPIERQPFIPVASAPKAAANPPSTLAA